MSLHVLKRQLFCAFVDCSPLLKVHQRLEERVLLVHATTLSSHINQFKLNCIFRVINSQVVPQNATWSGAQLQLGESDGGTKGAKVSRTYLTALGLRHLPPEEHAAGRVLNSHKRRSKRVPTR